MPEAPYDIALIGGGLAGLAMSIQCARAGHRVVLFEKEKYPFHKVCGEYISLEAWDFLEDLGVPLSEMNLPVIRKLQVSAPSGNMLRHNLPLGGFGLSRYMLDNLLAGIARNAGVEIRESDKVEEVDFDGKRFLIHSRTGIVESRLAAGTFGKRSNLDMKWQREFTLKKPGKLNNFVGVKYHANIDLPKDMIALHNFSQGYCGVSAVEGDTYCICYLTSANNLHLCNNSIPQLEKKILQRNPMLKEIFSHVHMLFKAPVTISQISFEKKTQVEKNMLMIGDSAGMIAPLCGNGMSMALHGSKIAFVHADQFLRKKLSMAQMLENYVGEWQRHFRTRLRTGRFIQRFFGNERLSNLLITTLKPFPGMVNRLISSTHGQPF